MVEFPGELILRSISKELVLGSILEGWYWGEITVELVLVSIKWTGNTKEHEFESLDWGTFT